MQGRSSADTNPTFMRDLKEILGFPGGAVVKNPPANAGNVRDGDSIPGLGRSPGVGNGLTAVLLPVKFHRQRSLAGYSPWGGKESDMTE